MEKDKKYSNEALLMNIIFAFRAILRSILFLFLYDRGLRKYINKANNDNKG